MSLSVCQVMAGAESGGLERHFVDLCNALAARHRVTAIAHPLHRAALDPAVRFVPLGLDRGRRNPFLLGQLLRAVRATDADLVHAQASKATAMLALIKPWLNTPLVATLHNRKRRLGAFGRCDGVIAVSRELARDLRAPHVAVVHNGIEPPPEMLPPQRISTALAVGRLVEAKGFDCLLQAWRDIDARLLIAGDGPQRKALADQIEALDLSARVTLLGQRDDIGALMANADLLLLPSRNEGFPYVLVEALQRARPVIATRVPGAVDLLPDACLVPVDDSRALAARVKRAIEDPARLHADFAQIWQMARQRLTLDAMLAGTEAFYAEVLHDR